MVLLVPTRAQGFVNDGAGDFALEFGNDGVANDSKLTPCSAADSVEMLYIAAILDWIAAQPTLLDAGRIYTKGFSQESMFSAYAAICFADRIAGVWQGGSGLALTGYNGVVPGYQAQCKLSDFLEYGKDCCSSHYCTECKYWPAWPRTAPHRLTDCLMAYVDDQIGCGSDWHMYEAMVAEGNDARLLSFPAVGKGHSSPENDMAWTVGCLGIVPSCEAACGG